MVNLAVIMFGAVAILAFDTIGALASRRFGFAYSGLMLGSFAIYVAVGFGTTSGLAYTGGACRCDHWAD